MSLPADPVAIRQLAEEARTRAEKFRADTLWPAGLPTLLDSLADALLSLLDEVERLRNIEEAARDVKDWLLLPSDVYPQQVERLGVVRQALDEALAVSVRPDRKEATE